MNINHCAGIRVRANGSGNLESALFSLDEIRAQSLEDFSMSDRSSNIPTILANFSEQGISLQLRVTGQGDYFRINSIELYIKPIAVEYPQ